jgi:hypothetical protein
VRTDVKGHLPVHIAGQQQSQDCKPEPILLIPGLPSIFFKGTLNARQKALDCLLWDNGELWQVPDPFAF